MQFDTKKPTRSTTGPLCAADWERLFLAGEELILKFRLAVAYQQKEKLFCYLTS